MPTPHLLVCDLDGTLIDHEMAVAPGVADALRELQGAGLLFAVCTGRPYRSACAVLRRAGLRPDILATYHGGLVVDLSRRRCLRHLRLRSDECAAVVGELGRNGLAATLYQGVWRREIDPRDAGADSMIRSATRVLAVGSRESLDGAQERLVAADLCAARVDRPSETRLDVRHRLAVKEEALRFIAGGCAVPLERVTACGDDASDVAMLRLAGRAVMVGDQPADGVDAPRLTRDRLAGHLRSLGAP